MSLDQEAELNEFFASDQPSKHLIQTLQLSHSAMSKVYYLWREPYAGQITLETDALVDVEPLNMEIRLAGSPGHLDQKYGITLCTVDVEDDVRGELDRIPLDTTEKIVAVYREYLSTDLTTPQVVGRLQVESITFERGKATLSAVSPRLNMTRTGIMYTYRDIPMLRGFL